MPRFAMCNEAFGETPFPSVCRTLREAGYTGIEIAPFTLRDAVPELRATMAGEGMEFVGLHWLMASPPGLHVTTPDAGLRKRSWEHVRGLVDLCGDLANGPSVMVFGSPKQRGTHTTGTPTTREEATRRFAEGLGELAPHAAARNVTVLVEALPANQCDVVQTLAEAAAIVREIGSPAIQTMFDTHNAVDERGSHAELIEEFFRLIRHVHVNEMDGRLPGSGDYDFGAVLGTLERLKYDGWISLEVFDFEPDAGTIARQSIDYLHSLL